MQRSEMLRVWSVALAIAALLVGGLAAAAPRAEQAPVAPDPEFASLPDRVLARLEPERGTLFGVSLDWSNDTAAAFGRRLGRVAAAYVGFTHFPVADSDEPALARFVGDVQHVHGLALLTVEPSVNLRAITPDMAAAFADRLATYNSRGVPVLVRFAQEMNGSWYSWSQQPAAYVDAFCLIAAAVHERAPMAAMLWAPNYGAGYPFSGGRYEAQPGTSDFVALDTNADGKLDSRDDMYAPYYPGDDAVDWVGMTLYHWGDTWPWGKNIVPEDGKFVAQLTGSYTGAAGDQRGLVNFYKVYAERHGKPVAIPETAALYNTSLGGDSELDIKRAWWRQVFGPDVSRELPAIKMINWFEWRKPEAEIGNAVVDWTATGTPSLQQAFAADLPTERLVFGPDLAAVPSQSADTGDRVNDTGSVAAPSPPASILDTARVIQFSGYTWRVRTAAELQGPGPNYFSDSPENAWVDTDGRLHLRITRDSTTGQWEAAEIALQASLGYGTYTVDVDSPLDDLDSNVVVGFFTWSDDPAENHRELDIEFARFGRPTTPVGRYTLQPYTEPGNVILFEQPPARESTHSFRWTPGRVDFESRTGSGAPIATYTFARAVPEAGDEQVHLNFWLDAGRPPINGEPVEIIIKAFRFSPAD